MVVHITMSAAPGELVGGVLAPGDQPLGGARNGVTPSIVSAMDAPGPQRAPWWRTAGYVAVCAFASLATAAYDPMVQRAEQGWQLMLGLVVLLLCLAVPALLIWRHQAPYLVTLVAAGVAVVLPVGAWTALVAMASLISRRRGPKVWWTAAAAAVATAVSVIRDAQGPTMDSSLLKLVMGPADAPSDTRVELSLWTLVGAVLLGVGVAVGAGLLVRARREAVVSAQQASAERVTTERLGDQLARQQERERIAREVHDVLGHRLSLVNLHAGAVESHARDHPQLAESARLVRLSATQSLEDLRSLLHVLREPVGAEPAAPDLSLRDLSDVIDETVQTGLPVTSSVYLDRPEQAPPALSRAVYRIVQELLTNARRHAPGEPVRLHVSGGPGDGVTVDARNRYTATRVDTAEEGDNDATSATRAAGHGMQGIAERVELMHGRLAYGLDDEGRTFRVTAWLPWQVE